MTRTGFFSPIRDLITRFYELSKQFPDASLSGSTFRFPTEIPRIETCERFAHASLIIRWTAVSPKIRVLMLPQTEYARARSSFLYVDKFV